ncbi:MAG: proton-conducting transporter membrane subunit, partial [Candidatus Omnitrophota bacterium]
KTLGLYALARIFFNVFGVHPAASMMLVVFAVLSMGVGSLMAFGQTDIKRLFAYSSISQVGYIALGLGVGTPLGILGALFHLVNHSVFKSLLFMTAGSIEHLTGTRDLRKIRGIAAICPVTGYSNLVASFSICGIPPLGGFWSKLMIIYACAVSGHTSLAIIAAVVAVMTMGYYFKFMTPVLFGTPAADAGTPRKGRLPLSMTLPMILLAGMCLASVLLIVPGFGAKLLMQATLVLGRGGYYSQLAMGLIQ